MALTQINIEKINNIIFFNPNIIKENEYKLKKYELLLSESEDLIIYPEKDDNMKKRLTLYKKFRNELYKDIRSSKKFCQGLMATYVKESINNCDFILRVESSQTRSKKLNGFATVKIIKNSKSLYIDTVCTNPDIKGTGTYIVKLLGKICREIGLEHIKLNSATQAVPFYLKSDFECDPLCKMIKTVGGSKTKKNKNFTHSKTIRNY